MALKLDIRAPLVVLAANFNPHIFNVIWVAQNLFGFAEGSEIPTTNVLMHNGISPTALTFIEGVALRVDLDRTELFALNADPSTLARIEQIVLRMLEILPYTPVSAIGCNLSYVDSEPAEGLVDLFTTAEGWEAEGVLNSRQAAIQLQLDDRRVLNFTRLLTSHELRFSFNYHCAERNPSLYREFVPRIIEASLESSGDMLRRLYSCEREGLIGLVPPNVEGGENA